MTIFEDFETLFYLKSRFTTAKLRFEKFNDQTHQTDLLALKALLIIRPACEDSKIIHRIGRRINELH